MRGFQLWINLPAREKMKPASYRDIPPGEIPTAALPEGGSVKVIAGTLTVGDEQVRGPIQGIATDPIFFDVKLNEGERFVHPIGADHNVFIYPYEGSVKVGPSNAARALGTQAAGVLSQGDAIEVTAAADNTRFIVLAARPLREPVVQYGPFVMNTREEIEQAINDYQNGKLTLAA